MKLFAGDAVLRALKALGMKEDEAIEHRWVSKSVERAQKKVEERNFGIRKNLLEYDEVRDVQRNFFYKARQQILEGRNLREMIFEVITDAVDDAVARFFDRDYVPSVIAEWVRSTFNCDMDSEDLRDNDVGVIELTIKDHARDSARTSITTSLDEFMDPDAFSEDWDYAGLSKWALDYFGVQIGVTQLKDMDRLQIRDSLIEAAMSRVNARDVSPVGKFLVKHYAQGQLADWVSNKFEIKIAAEDLIGKNIEEASAYILEHAAQSYSQRENEYPIEYALEEMLRAGGTENIYNSEQLATWIRGKYNVTMTGDQIRAVPVNELHRQLVAIAAQAPATLEKEIDNAVAKLTDQKELLGWAAARFHTPADSDFFVDMTPPQIRDELQAIGKAFLRQELTELERAVLLQIYDSTWKDHLYAMDQLRESIGLRGFAEKDPRIEFKKEGTQLFKEFQRIIRDKVTDSIFKVRLNRDFVMKNVYQNPVEAFQPPTGYGVAESPATQSLAAETQAAGGGSAGSTATEEAVPKVAQIVNTTPKVGRNDPCPCGSGKKYKKCCGK